MSSIIKVFTVNKLNLMDCANNLNIVRKSLMAF